MCCIVQQLIVIELSQLKQTEQVLKSIIIFKSLEKLHSQRINLLILLNLLVSDNKQKYKFIIIDIFRINWAGPVVYAKKKSNLHVWFQPLYNP